jgi:hypothetical protein
VSLKSGFRLAKRRTLALLGLDVWQLPQVRVPTVRLGDPGVAGRSPPMGSPSTVVWALGVGTDVSFERDLIARYGVTVHAFDPPDLDRVGRPAALPDRFHFHHYGVRISTASPASPRPEAQVRLLQHGARWWGGERGGQPGALPGDPAEMFRPRPPDVLKMDIEGAEYAVLADLLAGDMRPAQILVEFHHRWREVGAGRTRRAIAELGRHGYRVAVVAPSGLEYTFVLAGGTRSGAR